MHLTPLQPSTLSILDFPPPLPSIHPSSPLHLSLPFPRLSLLSTLFSLSVLLFCRLWQEAVSDSLKPRPELWSHPVIDSGFDSAVRFICSQRQSHLQMMEPNGVDKDCVSISSCEEFDWSLEDASPFLLNLKELSLGNVSPDTATMVAYLRSNVVSPVEVEMDVEQATAGACTCAHTYSTCLQYMYVVLCGHLTCVWYLWSHWTEQLCRTRHVHGQGWQSI